MSSELKNKMHQWESQPPGGTWNRIASALDADEEFILSKKLSSFQSQPHSRIWENIETELDKQEPGKLVSFYKQHKRIFQYTSAAAVLIFVAILTSLFITNHSAPNDLTEESSIKQHHQQMIQSNSAEENTHLDLANTSERQVPNSTNPTVATQEENNQPIARQSFIDPSRKVSNGRNQSIISQWKQAKDSLVNRYFVHTNKYGEPVRFSSKLYGLFECSDEWTDNECAQQIKLWQQKAATSSMFASADFTGVLEMINAMDNEQ